MLRNLVLKGEGKGFFLHVQYFCAVQVMSETGPDKIP